MSTKTPNTDLADFNACFDDVDIILAMFDDEFEDPQVLTASEVVMRIFDVESVPQRYALAMGKRIKTLSRAGIIERRRNNKWVLTEAGADIMYDADDMAATSEEAIEMMESAIAAKREP